MFFRKSDYVLSAVSCLQRVIESSPEYAKVILDESPYLTSLHDEPESLALAYYLTVACVDMIYIRSIVKFGVASRESQKVASALRREFEKSINSHLMSNLEGLHNFTKDTRLQDETGLTQKELMGGWVVMAYEKSRQLDMTMKRTKTASRELTKWIEKLTESAFE